MIKTLLIVTIFLRSAILFGQVEMTPTELKDIKGDFRLYWELNEDSFLGEKLVIKRGHKFEYRVFSVTLKGGYTNSEQTIVKGKYKINADTLKLKPSKDFFKVYNREFFNLKLNFLVKSYEINNHKDKNRYLICLVGKNKRCALDSIVKLLPDKVMDYQATPNLKNKTFNEIGPEAEMLFYKKKIFINTLSK